MSSNVPATPLFRQEVMQAQAGQWLGSIRVGRPLGFSLVTGVALLMAAALVSFAIWGEYTRKVTLPGVLMPETGIINLSSNQPATVAEILVREGDWVKAGQPLIKLRAERVVAGGELGALQAHALEQRRQGLQTELRLAEQQGTQRTAALVDRQRSLNSDLVTLQGELDAHQQRLQLAQKTQQRFEELAASGYVSGLQAQQKQEELLDLNLRERNTRRALEAVQRELAAGAVELDANRGQIEVQRSQLQRALASLEQEGSELGARSEWALIAAQAGQVTALNVTEGQAAVAGVSLLTMVPQDTTAVGAPVKPAALVAHLYAPSRAAGFLEPGQTVWLRYAAYPYQKFGMHAGRVTAVSRTPISLQDLPPGQAQVLMRGAQSNEPMYRVSVGLGRQNFGGFNRAIPLRPGLVLEALTHQEGRKIWEWLLEPILVLGARVSA
ncbi:membrane fusion protein [Inhella inkyongensis]|uniref:Membrane fusion protein n=1 Tax=Inhella inkyongensis TaxID=392593 RepID=A0A840SB86_9BURK|nr:HlyD family efflux transporter periplasmic adaptor subunit [Inhella inkyongensis]MBB5205610.1 membrane fusion protein [Inhella inkyongensis]